MNTDQIYQNVTDTIIELLEDHLLTYDRPWIGMGVDNDYARNPSTGKYYRGINQFLLSFMMMKKGFLKNQWATFKQIKSMNGKVRKGEKSTPVIFYKTAYVDKDKKYYTPETINNMSQAQFKTLDIQAIPILKLYRVFNLQAQTDSLPEEYYDVQPVGELQDFEKDERAETLIKSTGAMIIEREGNDAYYDRVKDHIVLPLRGQFKGVAENYYSVTLHELGHWTGGTKRLNREFGQRFGDATYAKEELVAELISAFACAHLGFSKTITQNAAYIKSWLAVLKSDPKAVITAATAAQKGADLILAHSSELEPQS